MSFSDRILVHACCASCSSYVLAHLQEKYDVTALFFNPNIQPEEEHELRLDEAREICRRLGIELIEEPGRFEEWASIIAPFAHLPEKSDRCRVCFRMRLEETAKTAAGMNFGLFTSTLSVSPHKIHRWIVEEGKAAGERYGVTFLEEDFKKKGGFEESCRKSREHGLTRQDYCGCPMSLEEARRRRIDKDLG
jgi:predicted adenine nucleotide alpha hydrolase (AANH) superfamily ATPase